MTSPSERVYIGQTRSLIKRKSFYRNLYKSDIIRQPKIFNSLKKYGFEAHNFEIINELPHDISQEILNIYEIFYIQQYKNSGFNMLNLSGGGANGKLSEETKEKLRQKQLGKKQSKETIEKRRQTVKERGLILIPPSNKGKKASPETRKKISDALMGKVGMLGLDNPKSRCVAQLLDNEILYVFETISEAIRLTKIPDNTISRALKNGNKHYGGGYKWKYITKEEFLELKPKNGDIYKCIELIQKKKIIAIGPDGTEIKFDSINDAARTLGAHNANIIKVLKGQRKTTKNFKFIENG